MQTDADDSKNQLPKPPKKRTLGTLKGKIQILDPDWWKPMTDSEVEDFLAGRY
jgi:hypothetical protein